MFEIDSDMTIHVTRGDIATFTVVAESNGKRYKFQPNDVVRIKVFQKKDASAVAFQKDFLILEEKDMVDLYLTGAETKIGDVISKPKDYWYEIELNPYTEPQTIIGYDDDGPKIFRVYPEGRDLSTIEREDIPYVDSELSLTSENPIQNQAVARALIEYEDRVALAEQRIEATATETESQMTEFSEAKKSEVENYSSEVVEDAKTEINTEADKAVERTKRSSDEAEESANRAEAEANRAKEEADRAQAVASGDFLPLTGGVSVKRAARTVFGVENTALNKATLAYWGQGVFMGEVGVDGVKGPIFRDASGNEKTLAGMDDLEEYIHNAPSLSAPILETAMTLNTGVYHYNLAGASYTGNDLPHVNYGYSPATIFVRANGAARVVVLWGIKHDAARTIQVNYFASGDGEWSGWNSYLPLSGGTVGSGTVNNPFTIKGALRSILRYTIADGTLLGEIGFDKDGQPIIYDSSNVKTTILHTGNKPTGSYTGNGSATERRIKVGGIGKIVYVFNTRGIAIVTTGGTAVFPNGGEFAWVSATTLDASTMEIVLKTDNANLNGSNLTFAYQVA